MTLSIEQLDSIRTFINSRGFSTIEVETEILDHVASAVEARLEENPHQDVDKVVRSIHRSFGAMGFSGLEDNLISNLGKQMNRKYLSNLCRSLTSIVVLKVLLTALAIFTALLVSANFFSPDTFQIVAFSQVAAIGSIPIFYHQRVFKKWGKKSLILGKLLWPFVFGAFSIAYLIQILPTDFINTEGTLFSLLLAAIALLLSTAVWTTTNFIKEVHSWAIDKWLKYSY